VDYQARLTLNSPVIELRAPLEIQPDPHGGGWQLILWAGGAFDYATPFRVILADIAAALGQNPRSDLQLPAHEEREDFVWLTAEVPPRFLRREP